MKDRLLLLAASIACSLSAWAFWRYAGDAGFGVLSTLFLVTAVVDNFRLRRQLRAERGE
jgi:hypothetical protein